MWSGMGWEAVRTVDKKLFTRRILAMFTNPNMIFCGQAAV
jgi:hypothetical protein